jgi:hypothetical protein
MNEMNRPDQAADKGRPSPSDATKAADSQRPGASAEAARFRDAYLSGQKGTAEAAGRPPGSQHPADAKSPAAAQPDSKGAANAGADHGRSAGTHSPADRRSDRELYLASQKAGPTADHGAGVQPRPTTHADHPARVDSATPRHDSQAARDRGPQAGAQPAHEAKASARPEAREQPRSADHPPQHPEPAAQQGGNDLQNAKDGGQPDRPLAEAIRGGMKSDDPALRKEATDLAQHFASQAFDRATGGTLRPETLATRWGMTPGEARAVVRMLGQEGLAPQHEEIGMDGSGRQGTDENLARREMADRIDALHGMFAAWRGARGGSAEEMRKADQDGDVARGLAGLGGGRGRADADWKNVRARQAEEAIRRDGESGSSR